jgi:hypothetical protein
MIAGYVPPIQLIKAVLPVTLMPLCVDEPILSKLFCEVKINHLSAGDLAPDFSLPDYKGRMVTLSDIYRMQNVLLVFNIGFL